MGSFLNDRRIILPQQQLKQNLLVKNRETHRIYMKNHPHQRKKTTKKIFTTIMVHSLYLWWSLGELVQINIERELQQVVKCHSLYCLLPWLCCCYPPPSASRCGHIYRDCRCDGLHSIRQVSCSYYGLLLLYVCRKNPEKVLTMSHKCLQNVHFLIDQKVGQRWKLGSNKVSPPDH